MLYVHLVLDIVVFLKRADKTRWFGVTNVLDRVVLSWCSSCSTKFLAQIDTIALIMWVLDQHTETQDHVGLASSSSSAASKTAS